MNDEITKKIIDQCFICFEHSFALGSDHIDVSALFNQLWELLKEYDSERFRKHMEESLNKYLKDK